MDLRYTSPATDSSPGVTNLIPFRGFPTPLTPRSSSENLKNCPMSSVPVVPENTTQDGVITDAALLRFQQDLLVLTTFNDNSTLHWRPTWFPQAEFATKFWTLHNPPNVVTEFLPLPGPKSSDDRNAGVFTRRMRRAGDPPPRYIKDSEHWARYCDIYGIPSDFLSATMVHLLRLGLPSCIHTVTSPMYPEPQPLGCGRYILDPEAHYKLPRQLRYINEDQCIVVHSSGALEVTAREPFYFHASQWTHFNGYGQHVDDYWYDADLDAPTKVQGKGRRWSHIPWTTEQERSCEEYAREVPRLQEEWVAKMEASKPGVRTRRSKAKNRGG